jgi:hypothetical protein
MKDLRLDFTTGPRKSVGISQFQTRLTDISVKTGPDAVAQKLCLPQQSSNIIAAKGAFTMYQMCKTMAVRRSATRPVITLALVVGSAISLMAAPPKVVSTIPANGATSVDSATTCVAVIFDQDMGKGMSWVGGGPHFPGNNQKAEWISHRECIMPVTLKPSTVYHISINNSQFRNFKSAAGESAEPTSYMFATTGTPPDQLAMMKPPKVVSFNPANGATNVNAAQTSAIAVSFDEPMGGGMSWTGGGPNFPQMTGKPTWSADMKTCTAPVKLKPSTSYKLGINSVSFRNFTNAIGIPSEPVTYTFTTAP